MSFETALRSRLKALPALAGAFVEWDVRPQASSYPAVVLETIGGERAQTMAGLQQTNRDRIQFNCFAMDKVSAVALREAVIATVADPAIVEGIEFQRGQIILHRSDSESTDAGTVRIEIVDAYLWHATV
ncbi:DUF3168 domain-containing protein [Novosphingobium sp. 9]|uniref:DUF3168 domain-containing protein n=1 Tax=Novosphingobium sp. 9 TaxID=2025349 RepID=UPI0021B5B95D|nr:DUF3168 domain-containing protein [Novosphingobium sp. 9]